MFLRIVVSVISHLFVEFVIFRVVRRGGSFHLSVVRLALLLSALEARAVILMRIRLAVVSCVFFPAVHGVTDSSVLISWLFVCSVRLLHDGF